MTAALPLLAALATSVVVGDRSELRLRDSGDGNGVAFDAETSPSVTVRADDRRWFFDAGYLPRFTVRTLLNGNGTQTDELQRALVGVEWRGRHARLTVREDMQIGTQSFTSLDSTSTTVGGRLQALPTTTAIDYLGTRTTLTLREELSRRWIATTTIDYAASGGLDASSQQTMPLQQGPRAELAFDHLASRLDHLGALVAASYVTFSSGPEAILVDAALTARHPVDRYVDLGFRAGATASSHHVTPTDEAAMNVWPVGEAILAARSERGQGLDVTLRLSPIIDRLTGLIDERGQVSIAARTPLAGSWSARASWSGSTTAYRSNAVPMTLMLGEVVFAFKASTRTLVELGARTAWQRQDGLDAPTFQWLGFVAATLAFGNAGGRS